MPLIELPLHRIILLDAVAWMIFHLTISVAAQRIPINWFARNGRLFKSFSWEQEGRIWQRLFRVKKWKGHIPDGTLFISNGYNKSHLHGADDSSLYDFLLESRRAECVHWLTILPGFLFFFWNPVWAAWLNVAYAVLFNVPLIVVQRFNRPRLERLLNSSR
ncbi:glycosyl-4,4'-diaponeurosporenoate acyltransferase [Sporosarcina ureae]|uniref:glycosyl-4,4'-diaponeurosporenoate acyltransferase CrtO family protein n=1 Tax=Sporosarcina ureae TaxID=1571 RepID=UPI0026F0D365|nr:glycosyl-4,4'-diaponeurosporenoate acyltransferase [Sporosarcina ureae]